jgi:hypothetical protein
MGVENGAYPGKLCNDSRTCRAAIAVVTHRNPSHLKESDMKKAPLAAAIALTLLPSLSAAMCTGDAHKITSASACGEGQVFDEATHACVTKPTS